MAVSTMEKSTTESTNLVNALTVGVISGLVGGGVFGVQMLNAGMLAGPVAQLVGSESVIVGYLVHMLISAFIGGTFGVIASRLPFNLATVTVSGVVYGFIWWILGALLIMPLVLGMNEMVFAITPALGSLAGHLTFGIIMGVTYYVIEK